MKITCQSILLLPVAFGLRVDRSLTDFSPLPRISWGGDARPLGLCAGDCDSNDDCAQGLACFHHDSNMKVPGCIGGEDNDSLTDYCIPEVLMPIEKAEIDILPSISWGGDVRPLGICAGDCDTHDDCADGLACFVHEANMAVPGCSGGEDNDSLTDYCIPEELMPVEKTETTNSTDLPKIGWSETKPLQMCEGDCDADGDCGEGMGCFHHDPNAAVPGCSGGEENDSKTDYCTDISLIPIPEETATDTASGEPKISWSTTKPLQMCEGDCDDDRDCAEGLVCFEHDPNTAVPGCSGGEDNDSNTDYCVPSDLAPASDPKISWSDSFPLGLCAGDCDTDDECEGDLVCFEHEPNQAVPGCRGGEDNDSKTDYCIVSDTSNASNATDAPSIDVTAPEAVIDQVTDSGADSPVDRIVAKEGGSNALLISLLTVGLVGTALASTMVYKMRKSKRKQLHSTDLESGDDTSSKNLASKFSIFRKTTLSSQAV